MKSNSHNYKFSSLINTAGKTLLATTAMTAAGFLSIASPAQAEDLGPWDLKQEQGSFTKDFSKPNTNTITQLSDRAIGTGDANIDLNETVIINQKDSSSLFVARDTKSDPTVILGNLKANGRVMVIDQNGIFFGKESQVNVGSIIASTGRTTDKDIMDGDNKLTITSSAKDGKIVNNGTIIVSEDSKMGVPEFGKESVAEAGVAAFVSPHIKNNGVIKAKMGKVVMAAGETVTLDMYGDGLVEVAVEGELKNGLIKNTGQIKAQGGEVLITASVAKKAVEDVINMDGIVDVSSATVKGGKIILSGGEKGRVKVSGKLKAGSVKKGQDAGSVNITGQNIKIEKTAKIGANAAEDKQAGDVIIVADNKLKINGTLSAQGLAGTGFIETSAPTTKFGNYASVLATREWLLDPTDILIDAALGTLIETQLGAGNMTVQTPAGGVDQGKITVNTIIDWSTANTFGLVAHDDIDFNNGGGINATGAGNFTATSGDDIRMRSGSSINTNGGNVTMTAVNEFTMDKSFIDANGGNITIDNGDSFKAQANSLRTSGTGNIEVNQNLNGDTDTFIGTPSIQNAIDAISNTGTGTNTVNVGAGIWDEAVQANLNNLILKGDNAGTSGHGAPRVPETIIQTASNAITVTADNVSIDGFTINSVAGHRGIDIDGATGTTIENNIINDALSNGIVIAGAMTTTIQNNAINGTGNDGIQGANNTGLTFTNNKVDGTRGDGISLVDSQGITITGNTITKTDGDGIEIFRSGNILLDNNTINLLGGNTALSSEGIELKNVSDITLTNNTISNVDQNGISALHVTGNALIDTNTITNSGVDGIHVQDFASMLINNNTLANNAQSGVHVYGPSSDNAVITMNNFTNDGAGVFLENVTGTMVQGNIFNNNNNAVLLSGTTSTTIDENTINGAGNDGIKGGTNTDVTITNNIIDDTRGDGISLVDSQGITMTGNTITKTDGDGIEIFRSGNILLDNNTINLLGGNTALSSEGIELKNVSDITLTNNIISNADQNGISALHVTGNALIDTNTITNSGVDGIHADDFEAVTISNNIISSSGDDGIEVLNTPYVLVDTNTVDGSGDDGIHILFNNVVPDMMSALTRVALVSTTDTYMESSYETEGSQAIITNNTITNSGTPFVERRMEEPSLEKVAYAFSEGEYITSSGGDGIEVSGYDDILVDGNTVENSVENGLFVSGPYNGNVVVTDNTFTNNDIGAHFQSGEIDLTGPGNIINSGRIGLRFAPAEEESSYYPYYPEDEYYYYSQMMVSDIMGPIIYEPVYADLSLVNDTIGAQRFNGQSSFFVELDNGALFNPGTPTILNENDSTYVNTPFGTFTPSVDYAGGYPADVLNYLETKLFHFNDDGTLGLFFLEELPEIDQEDIFRTFGPIQDGQGGMNVTIVSLPNTNLPPRNFNNIAPNAGGTPSPEDLNNIETAAGASESTCWGDALNTAGLGQATTFNYSGSAEDLLNGEASCANTDI